MNQERHEIQIRGLKEELKMQEKLIMDIRRQIEKLQSKWNLDILWQNLILKYWTFSFAFNSSINKAIVSLNHNCFGAKSTNKCTFHVDTAQGNLNVRPVDLEQAAKTASQAKPSLEKSLACFASQAVLCAKSQIGKLKPSQALEKACLEKMASSSHEIGKPSQAASFFPIWKQSYLQAF